MPIVDKHLFIIDPIHRQTLLVNGPHTNPGLWGAIVMSEDASPSAFVNAIFEATQSVYFVSDWVQIGEMNDWGVRQEVYLSMTSDLGFADRHGGKDGVSRAVSLSQIAQWRRQSLLEPLADQVLSSIWEQVPLIAAREFKDLWGQSF